MKILENYYEEYDADPTSQSFIKNPSELSKYISNLYTKELEVNLCTNHRLELQTLLKNDENGASYSFIIEGSQEEMEKLLVELYLQSYISWIPKYVFVPKKGLKIKRNSDGSLFTIAHVDSYSFVSTICSSSGDIFDIHESKIKQEFSLA